MKESPTMKLLSLFFLTINVIVMYGQSILKDSIFYDDGYREHIIHLPESFDVSKSYPLVFILHGGRGNAEFTMNYKLFNETSNTNEFIAVYPNGSSTRTSINGWISRHWADGRTTLIPDEMGFNDVQYIDNLIDTIQNVYSIDLRKVYASGISNGGFMFQRLACELSNRIAAVATVAANFPDSLVSKCNPTPTSIMFVNGTSDSFVPTFTGGMLPFGAGGWVRSTDLPNFRIKSKFSRNQYLVLFFIITNINVLSLVSVNKMSSKVYFGKKTLF